MTNSWMRTDEREDVLSSLKLFIDAMSKVEEDPSYWKWAVISLHSSVQSIMAFHLGFGSDLLVMSQTDAEEWLAAHYDKADYPETQMDSFLNLYKKIKKHEIFGYKFKPSGQEGSSIKKLNMLRNEFIHFMPKGWSIATCLMMEVFVDCLNIINTISTGPIQSRWENEDQSKEFTNLLVIAHAKVNA